MALTISYANSFSAEFRLNTLTLTDQLAPDVLGLRNGGFVVAYNANDINNGQLFMDFYDANFNHLQLAFPANAYGFPDGRAAIGQPSLTELTNGNVLVVWEDSEKITATLFTPTGTKIGQEINLGIVGAKYGDPQVAALNDGGFAVSFAEAGFNNERYVYQARYDAAGVFRGESFVSPEGLFERDSSVFQLADGRYYVIWTDYSLGGNNLDIRASWYNADGTAIQEAFLLGNAAGSGNQHQAKGVGLPNGNFAFVYTDSAWQDENGTQGITLEILPANATFNIATVHVNTATAGLNQNESDPDIAVLPNGFIVVTWTRPTPSNPADRDIYGRVFDQNGAPVTINGSSAEFIVTNTGSDDTLSAVSRMLGGKFITAWQDSFSDADAGGSGGRITGRSTEITRTVVGDGANDRFVGDQLRDTFTGGAGDDFFGYRPGGNADTVIGFVAGAGTPDKLVLPQLAGAGTLADVLAKATQMGGDTVFNFGNGDTLTLQGVTKANLHADDFILDFFGASAFAFNSFGASPAAGGFTSNDKYPRTAADVNGDGRADLVGFGDTGVYVALANANGTFQNLTFAINSFGFSAAGGGWANNNQYPRTLGDVNGDGRADIVGFGDAATFVALGNADGTFQAPIAGINSFGFSPAGGGWTTNDKYPRTVGDVNGDGRADLIGFGDAGVFVALGNANGTFQSPVLAINSFGFSAAGGGWASNSQYPRTAGDVNGDGRDDLVGFGDTGVYVALGNANGTFQSPILAINSFGFSPAGGGWTNNNQYPRHVADVNDDGRADLVGFGDTGIYIALGNANGTFAAPLADLASFGPNAGGWASNNQYPRTLADVNGDGAADVIGFGDAGVFVSLSQDFVV